MVPVIYILCNKEHIVYVGQTIDIERRLREHRHNIVYDKVYVRRCLRSQLNRLERACIKFFRPLLNRKLSTTLFWRYDNKIAECKVYRYKIEEYEFSPYAERITDHKHLTNIWFFCMTKDEPLQSVLKKIHRVPMKVRRTVITSLRRRVAGYKYKAELITIINNSLEVIKM